MKAMERPLRARPVNESYFQDILLAFMVRDLILDLGQTGENITMVPLRFPNKTNIFFQNELQDI